MSTITSHTDTLIDIATELGSEAGYDSSLPEGDALVEAAQGAEERLESGSMTGLDFGYSDDFADFLSLCARLGADEEALGELRGAYCRAAHLVEDERILAEAAEAAAEAAELAAEAAAEAAAVAASGCFRAYDQATEWMGPARASEADAQADADQYNAGCAGQGGYGSAKVVVRDGDHCAYLDGATVWPAHGRGCGAVRWAQ